MTSLSSVSGSGCHGSRNGNGGGNSSGGQGLEIAGTVEVMAKEAGAVVDIAEPLQPAYPESGGGSSISSCTVYHT